MTDPSTPVRTMREWSFTTTHAYAEPFTDVRVTATLTSPSGTTSVIEAFHDGDSTWRVRFNPRESGRWTLALGSVPANPEFNQNEQFDVEPADVRGFWRSTPGEAWGFSRESGDSIFVLGDTVYHLFGMAHNSEAGAAEVRAFMERRAEQGFNVLRIRLPVSYFHPPDGYNTWQTRRLWPWGGSEQLPRFDQFNLPYFRTVDMVLQWADELGLGIEMIMEAWGNEFPFNSRHIFVAEWEELWLRYLVARFDAFGSVAFWTLHNEYEYYPNGDLNYSSNHACDRWAIRIAHLVRRYAPHGHIVAIHNGPRMPSFADRFRSDPQVIDTVMFQDWGDRGEEEGWLATGIEEQIRQSLDGWPGTAILSEYGYEFNPDLPRMMLSHEHCGPDHTRRGVWRGAMSGLGVIHGFENSWGPFQVLDQDQPGLVYLLHLRAFFTDIVPFARLRSAEGLVHRGNGRRGYSPLTLATPERDTIVVYLPAGGDVTVAIDPDSYGHRWFDPRSGTIDAGGTHSRATYSPPQQTPGEHPDDWVLILRRDP